MKRILSALSVGVLLAACGDNQPATQTTAAQNAAFDGYKTRFVEALWKVFPEWASSVGYHKYDSVLTVQDDAARTTQLNFVNAQLDSMKQFVPDSLNPGNMTDYRIMENQLKSIAWGITDMKSYTWNPAEYNVCGGFSEMLNNNYDSLDVRVKHFYERMANVPAFYAAAEKNIKNPTLEHTQLAIDQNTGGVSVFDKDFPAALEKLHLDAAEKQKMLDRCAAASKAVKDYADWLKNLKNDSPRSFRLGKELYAKKFEYDIQSGYTIDQVYAKALAHKKELHNEMYKLAVQLWPKYMDKEAMPADTLQTIRKVIDKISLQHTTPDSFQVTIEKQLPVLTNFIKEKDLLYLDPSKPLVVRREPDYMAGVAGASINSPGPYDKNGNTYYNVGSMSGWTAERSESYLREYNKYVLQILNMHEAIPGHYTQGVYSNQSPSMIKALFGCNSMIEGWAVYTERMMLESGYDNSPEMWLMYYKWNLRSTCNTILDYSVHTMNMSQADAMHLLVDEAFQQQAEAEGKWRRVSVTQVQLTCYFTGYTEIYDFREELKKQQGDKFNLKAFHEKFLSYGSAPVKYIRELMLAEKK